MFLRRKQSGRLIGRTSSRSVFNGTLVILLSFCILLGLFGWKNASAEDYVCDLEEHTDAPECYSQTLICDNEDSEHEHTDECYGRTLICDKTEHNHTEACLVAAETEEAAEQQEETTEEYGVMAMAADEDSGIEAYASNISKKANVIEGTTPSNTVINLFDYWLQDTDIRPTTDQETGSNKNYYGGINQRVKPTEDYNINNYYAEYDRPLQFVYRSGFSFLGAANCYVNNGENDKGYPVQGIVENKLGSDGYPILNWHSEDETPTSTSTFWPHNIANMTDQTKYPGQTQTTADYDYSTFQKTNSLAYLFDTSSVKGNQTDRTYTAGKMAYTNVDGLFQVDRDGNYYYNCTENYAQFDEEDNKFILYDKPVGYGDLTGQFFPFASYDTAVGVTNPSNQKNRNLNHYFGLTMTTRFIQNYSGYTSAAKKNPMIFDFSGDDDVWIFIDDVLVADLGGIHDKAGVTINFATGNITYTSTGNKLEDTTIYDQFVAAEAENTVKWNKTNTTFVDNTSHTLKFFYMERGDNQSNMILTTNLSTIPETSVSKVDQYGTTMSGAGLAAYTAALATDDGTDTDPTDSSQYRYVVDPKDENETKILVDPSTITADMVSKDDGVITLTEGNLAGRTITPKIWNVTNSDGNWIFSDSSGVPYTTKDLIEEVFGSEEIIIREYNVPDGYRTVSDNILLYFDQREHLTTPNPYESGVWPSPNVLVTSTNTLYLSESMEINNQEVSRIDNFYDVNTNQSNGGTLFAVVLKRNGAALDKFEDWSPICGNETEGYTVLDPGISNVLKAYQTNINEKYSDPTFQATSAGMQVLLTDLPGSLDRYYTYLFEHGEIDDDDPTEPQYLVAYYYSPLSSTALLDLNLEKAEDLATATSQIRRVISHKGLVQDYTGFMTNWSATIEITNIENRLYYQKYDEQGNPVNRATFALYNAAEETVGENVEVYFPVTSNNTEYKVFLADDDDLDNKGTATIKYNDSSVTGTYQIGEVDGIKGVITVSADGINLQISPAVNAETDEYGNKTNYLVGTTKNSAIEGANTGDSGTNFFTKLLEGNYILREIDAPDGYEMNTSLIKVLVNGDGVYANAGTADDGVIVGNGAGFLIPTFSDCASHNDIDETLTWIYTLLRVNETDNTYDALDSLNVLYSPKDGTLTDTKWFYANTNGASNGLAVSTTDTRNQAMVTYLEYGDEVEDTETHKIFDYIVNTDTKTIDGEEVNIAQLARNANTDTYTNDYPTTDGQGTLRLYTDVGWSELSILQDYEWGLDHRSKKDANNSTTYTNLTSQDVYGETNVNMNLAHLFSNSTFVRVTDPRPIDVQLTKVDPTKEGSQKYLTGAEFILYQETGLDENGNSINQYYNYDSTNGTSWVSDLTGATAIKFNENSQDVTSQDSTTQVNTTQTVHGLISGTYYLKETKAPSGYVIETQPWKMVLTETELAKTGEPEAAAGAVSKAIVELYNPDSTDNPQTATIYIFSTEEGLTYKQLDANAQPLVLELENTQIYNLPSSGSFGVLPFILAGSLILGFSVYLLIREERQTKA